MNHILLIFQQLMRKNFLSKLQKPFNWENNKIISDDNTYDKLSNNNIKLP